MVITINGASLVTVQPRSVSAKGNQIPERGVIIIEIAAHHGRIIEDYSASVTEPRPVGSGIRVQVA